MDTRTDEQKKEEKKHKHTPEQIGRRKALKKIWLRCARNFYFVYVSNEDNMHVSFSVHLCTNLMAVRKRGQQL